MSYYNSFKANWISMVERFRNFITQKKLNIIQTIAIVISSIAIPIIVANFQSSSAKSSINQEYVKIAINILQDQNSQKNEELREWAVDVVNKYSPVPFSKELRNQLSQGSINISAYAIRISPPDEFMSPCEDLPLLQSKTMGALAEHDVAIIEAYGRCQIKLQGLQKWIKEN